MFDFTIVTEPEDLDKYRDIWYRLFDKSAHEPSTSFEWTNSLRINHSKLFSIFFLVLIKKNSDIVGIIPMITREDNLFGRKLVTISPISELYNTHSDLLINELPVKVFYELLGEFKRLPFNWDLFRMTKLLDGYPLFAGLETALTQTGFRFRNRHEPPSFYLTLDDTLEKYLNKRSGKFRNYLKRMQKKLGAQGKIRFVNITNAKNFDNTYHALLDIEKNTWKHQHGTAISSLERQTGFYKDLCYEALKSGRLHLLFLYLDDAPIAYDMGFIHGKQYSYLKTSFHEQYKAASPATVLRAKLIELLIADGIRIFDFPGEPYTWEKQWTNELRWHKSMVVFNTTLTAKLYALLMVVKDTLHKRHAKEDIDYCDPRDLTAPRQ